MKSKHTQKSKDCAKCDGRCNSDKKCHAEEFKEITAEKNTLNISWMVEGADLSGPDISATYEIVIFNRSCHDLTCLTIYDSFMGLMPNTLTPDGTFGGELRPYFTNVTAETLHPTIVPNSFEQIVAAGGNLLGPGSYVPARSVCTILVRITGRGFLLPVSPAGGPQIPFAGSADVNMAIQNTSLISGSIKKKKSCGCNVCVPMFPLYIKSGLNQTQKVANIVLPQFEP